MRTLPTFASILLGVLLLQPVAARSAVALENLRPGHPRLLLTDADLAKAIADAEHDPIRAALHERILATAGSILDAPFPRHIPASNESLDQARYTVFNLLHCALAYRLDHDERFLDRARSEIANVLAYPDWNPDHFLDVGETSFAVALAYDWLFDALRPEERTAIRNALTEKALRLAEAAYRSDERRGRRIGWAHASSNWNQVINGGIICAALAVADEEPELATGVLDGAIASLPIGMQAYAPDGQYPEGPGYWSYGTTYNVIAIAALESALGENFGLDEAPGFARTIGYVEAIHGATGRPFNYADSTDDLQNSPARAWLSRRFAHAIGEDHTRALLEATLREGPTTPFDPTIQIQVMNRLFPLHAVWFPEKAPAGLESPPRDEHFGGIADLAVFRSEWNDPRALFLGLKAGTNAFRHNHLDLGSFVLESQGVRWAVDLGPDSYSVPLYFKYKGGRWSVFRTNNLSHNTVTPGHNVLQAREVTAPITRFESSERGRFAITDLGAAYPDQALRLERGVALLGDTSVLIRDEFVPRTPETPLTWRMVTWADIRIDGRQAILEQEGRTLSVEVLSPESADLGVEPATPPTEAENPNRGAKILVVRAMAPDPTGVVTVEVLLSPGNRPADRPVDLRRPLADW